ncbi:MAG: metal ABC transporter ATP-binding protein [Anaerolineae bacterium]
MTIAEAASPAAAFLELQDVSIVFDGKPVLVHVTLSIDRGEQIAVVGPNGAGKTTLFKALVGLLPLRSGRIRLAGQDPSRLRIIAYVPQREEIDWGFPVTVRDVVAMGRYAHRGWLRPSSAHDRLVVNRCLETLDLSDLAERPIAALSGGQQQRVFLARALAQEPELLLLDEPFTGIDIATQQAALQLFPQLARKQVTVLVSTHDLQLAAQHFDRVLLLNQRVIAFGPPAEVLTAANLSEAMGARLYRLADGSVLAEPCCPARGRRQ